jgi:hypothetical protein
VAPGGLDLTRKEEAIRVLWWGESPAETSVNRADLFLGSGDLLAKKRPLPATNADWGCNLVKIAYTLPAPWQAFLFYETALIHNFVSWLKV